MTPEPAEAFNDWYLVAMDGPLPIVDKSTYLRVWEAACRWQGEAIAKAQIEGWKEAWLAPS